MSEEIKFREFTLDRFQVEAIKWIDKHVSVVVSAATGTGKTLIADYVIDRSFKHGKKVFYTAPIKALSNQKFSQFKKLYGKDNVGILTGDVVINPEAPLLIMTTEIYRNMLLSKDQITDDLQAVIFDEIHFLGDRERGTVWEESIIFSPDHVRFLCLSATIPNARQFANWIQQIKNHEVKVVTEATRAVPLEMGFFDNRFGFADLDEISARQKKGKYNTRPKGRKQKKVDYDKLTHINLIQNLAQKERIPCIYFCFSRKSTELKADELSSTNNFVPKSESSRLNLLIDKRLSELDPAIARLNTTKLLAKCLSKGVAFHHAGVLPALKELVEEVFAESLLYVLYATETFAVGINLPARTVCFDSLEKYDGFEFRYLKSKEYFQMAGRAGRRGIDKIGYVYSYLDPEYSDLNTIRRITSSDSEPLESQYKLSYNTILNLIAGHNKEKRVVILGSSFYTYQKAGKRQDKMLKQYEQRVKTLIDMEYLSSDGETLTLKGRFARNIYQEELVLTELFTSALVDEYTDVQILLLVASIEFEPRYNLKFKKGKTPHARQLMELFKPYRDIFRYFKKTSLYDLEPLINAWYSGREFTDLLELTTMSEGDIIRFFRRIIDVLQQIEHATEDEVLRKRARDCIKTIDRDVVEVRL